MIWVWCEHGGNRFEGLEWWMMWVWRLWMLADFHSVIVIHCEDGSWPNTLASWHQTRLRTDTKHACKLTPNTRGKSVTLRSSQLRWRGSRNFHISHLTLKSMHFDEGFWPLFLSKCKMESHVGFRLPNSTWCPIFCSFYGKHVSENVEKLAFGELPGKFCGATCNGADFDSITQFLIGIGHWKGERDSYKLNGSDLRKYS